MMSNVNEILGKRMGFGLQNLLVWVVIYLDVIDNTATSSVTYHIPR